MSEQVSSYVSSTIQQGVLVVAVQVEQVRDHSQAYALRDEIIALLESSKTRDVILDLERLQFMGSVGILAFLGVRRHLDGGRIMLCNLSKNLRGMFQVCRLISSDSIAAPFEAEDTVGDALMRLTGCGTE